MGGLGLGTGAGLRGERGQPSEQGGFGEPLVPQHLSSLCLSLMTGAWLTFTWMHNYGHAGGLKSRIILCQMVNRHCPEPTGIPQASLTLALDFEGQFEPK